MRAQQPHDAQRRGAVAAREARAVHERGARAERARVRGRDPRARGGGADAARLVGEVLQQHLGEEVVRLLVRKADEPLHRRGLDAGQHTGIVRRHAGARLQSHGHAAGLQRVVQAGGRECRRIRLVAAATLGGEAAVVGEAAERSHPRRHAVARVRTPAQCVEGRLVAVHPPGDALDAGVLEQRGQVLHGCPATVGARGEAAAAERGVAAAAQVDAAAEDALGVELARAEHLGAERALCPDSGPEPPWW